MIADLIQTGLTHVVYTCTDTTATALGGDVVGLSQLALRLSTR